MNFKKVMTSFAKTFFLCTPSPERLSKIIKCFFPKELEEKILKFGYDTKIEKNLNYIEKNQKKVKIKLKQKLERKEKLNVAFYVYDPSKWKCQSLYEQMEKDERFEPIVFATKCAASKENFNYQTKKDVEETYEFFKKKNMKVKYAFDISKDKFIPFEKMKPKPDIIIYQHPWYVETFQGPVVCSKFALTFYVPYFIATTKMFFEYGLRFHQYVTGHFVLNESIKDEFSKKIPNEGKNLISVGHPQIDEILKDKTPNEEKYIIYAPHWSVTGENIRLSTFDWSAKFIQDFAFKNKDLNWVFKPHPLLYNFLISSNFMSKKEVDEYFNRWGEIGEVFLSGAYVPLFKKSSILITDCGSFLTEYLFTKKPCVHLISKEGAEFNKSVQKISNSYYQAKNKEELEEILNSLIFEKNDYKKPERQACLEELELGKENSSSKIIEEISKFLRN